MVIMCSLFTPPQRQILWQRGGISRPLAPVITTKGCGRLLLPFLLCVHSTPVQWSLLADVACTGERRFYVSSAASSVLPSFTTGQ